MMRTEFTKLLKLIRKNSPGVDLDIIRRAYRMADRAHAGQFRLSGDPYLSHPLAVARILAMLNLDTITVVAGLLHDVVEDTPITREDLQNEFGETVAMLVEAVTKIGAMPAPQVSSRAEKQAASLRKMLVATVRDVRVLLIKLADRLHNMRTIEFLPPDKIERISRETMDIYAPLAHRLGIARWKWELEDHAFHRLYPTEYKEVAARVAMKRREREEWLGKTIEFLSRQLAAEGIAAQVIGRPKHLYSIYRKMLRQGKDFDEIRDIQAIRIITTRESECYEALGVVHRLWTPIAGGFKDYIAMAKANGYQSIHSSIMCEDGMPLEIQIRTEEMDRTAQEGIAAHWKYKEGYAFSDTRMEEDLKWLKQMFESLREEDAADEFLDDVRRGVQMSEVFVFTPKGEIRELPAGATPLDFAYSIHTDIGHRCFGARVNGRIVPISYTLQTGDSVEILTSKNQTPHVDWLDIVVSARARAKIRQRLREMGEIEPLEPEKPKAAPPRPAVAKAPVRVVDEATRGKLIRVEGAKNMAVSFAKCCNPMPGHEVIGYATRGTGIIIHRADCGNFLRTRRDPGRMIEASWEGERRVHASLRVTTGARPTMLADITNAIAPLNINITHAQFMPGENGQRNFDVAFDASDKGVVDRVVRVIRTVPGVVDIAVHPVPDTPKPGHK
ncbi:MAG TPA: bifunctional (p)ppGpp synthetase/guanosine-3',5'-bis(diphosphate) 3'-pyrophosphohydrolase [Candidatus Hydrogenedentes bacterium]|nr:bifunctional (p)ppGpp synthetase/guanosine-3',5'-bis(diphosphate) 3'-pyrophosphohydrolase [Candidatus Hydrogenedentota bacterium]HPC15896.1 bifunctional (p)ppGpp synthetase/guanosine-3',5'-bis(diphosphate) 3'-pyrophosphohydrolase [Candidatus Hydrogenedentota bacterium]HRT19850.1 bifunctional (p)ppGpp synthetase/guanosine-3',5'-bis(diphosphate) 3'-pyrophosphohydrolase [Candidatus Hydrogenedentota bacterium]HRT65430.1 bifunctional (p)ppGpp synthetase/guanosine-3',5'-bis(diphosphate) 3'-pyrophos